MPDTVIENPILNSPFASRPGTSGSTTRGSPTRSSTAAGRVRYFVPIAQPKKKGKQLSFDTEWTKDRIEENEFVNRIRERVALWRRGGYAGDHHDDPALLEYWTDPERESKLFFCQIEALETAIYITEVRQEVRRRLDRERAPRRPTTRRTRLFPHRASRWRPAAARRSSWRCSSPGRRSTSWPTRRTPASPTPS